MMVLMIYLVSFENPFNKSKANILKMTVTITSSDAHWTTLLYAVSSAFDKVSIYYIKQMQLKFICSPF